MLTYSMRLNRLVLTLIFVSTGFVFSQECNIKLRGKIIDLHEDSPLDNAFIQILETNQTAVSSAKGDFVFDNLCPGKLIVKISHISCEDLIKEIDLRKSVDIKFFMEHHIAFLEEVIIEESQVKKLSSTAKTYLLSERQRDRSSSQGLGVALENISGVNNIKTGNNIVKPVIHGMFGSRIGIIYNGIPLENQQWGQDHAPTIDHNAFENIRLIKGAGTLKYSGDSPGGVIVLESKSLPIRDTLYGKTIINGMTNGRGVNLISSWVRSLQSGNYFKIQGTLKKNGDYSSPDYILSNTGNEEKNITFSLGRNKILSQWKVGFSFFSNEIGILRSSHIGNVDDLLRAIESKSPLIINPFTYDVNAPKQKNKHHTAFFQYSKRYDFNSKLNFQYSWQRNNRQEFDIRRGDNKNKASVDLLLNTHIFNSNFEWGRAVMRHDSGIFLQIQDNFSNPDTQVKRLIPDYFKTKYGSYFTTTITPSNAINYDFGIRWESHHNSIQKYYDNRRWEAEQYESLYGSYVIKEVAGQKLVKRKLVFNNISVNAGMNFNLGDAKVLGLNFYLTQRAPDISEMFSDGLHHALATIEYGDPSLTQETTKKVVFNFEKNKGALQYSIGPYLSWAQNFIIIEPEGLLQTTRGAFPFWEFKAVDAMLKGIDFDLSFQINDYISFEHSSSWIEGINRNTKTPLINMPPVNIRNHFLFSLPRWKSFLMALTSNNFLRQNQFPDNNFYTDVVENGKIVNKLVDISTPPDAYHHIGMEMHWGPYSLKHNKIRFSIIFDNMLNTNYRTYLNRLRFYADEMGRNVMLQIKFNH